MMVVKWQARPTANDVGGGGGFFGVTSIYNEDETLICAGLLGHTLER